MKKSCMKCFNAKTMVFRSEGRLVDWANKLDVMEYIKPAIKRIRSKGKVRVYWCSMFSNPRIYITKDRPLDGGSSIECRPSYEEE